MNSEVKDYHIYLLLINIWLIAMILSDDIISKIAIAIFVGILTVFYIRFIKQQPM